METKSVTSRARATLLAAVIVLAMAVLAACDTTNAVIIRPSDDAQSVVNAHPEGTVFLFKQGTHYGVNILPKNGQSFVGEPGAVLDGQGSSNPAFASWNGVKEVAIFDLEITNYATTGYTGVIDARSQNWNDANWGPASNWAINNVHMHHNKGSGDGAVIHVGTGTWVTNSRIQHNNGVGIYGNGKQVRIVNNIVANNANGVSSDAEMLWHSGGMKLVMIQDSFIENNTVYSNEGPGVWIDVSGDNILIKNNTIYNNTLAGIHYEISRNAVIRGNTLSGNGFGDNRGWLHPTAIAISSSHHVKIHDNVLKNNAGGIGVFDQRTLRNADGGQWNIPSYGRLYDTNGQLAQWRTEDVLVTNNVVHNSGISGASATNWESYGSNVYASTSFDNNHWSGTNELYWGSGTDFASPVSGTAWRAAGNE